MKLAASEIVLGVLLTIFGMLYSLYGFPTMFQSGNITIEVMPTQAAFSAHLIISAIIMFLGMGVTALGIIQLMRSRDRSPTS